MYPKGTCFAKRANKGWIFSAEASQRIVGDTAIEGPFEERYCGLSGIHDWKRGFAQADVLQRANWINEAASAAAARFRQQRFGGTNRKTSPP